MSGVDEMRVEGMLQRRAARIWLTKRVNDVRRDLGLPTIAQEKHDKAVTALKSLGDAAQAAALSVSSLRVALSTVPPKTGAQIEETP